VQNETPITRFGSGRAVRRVEDEALLTGRGQFTDDFTLAGEVVLHVLRSPHAHARIMSIDPGAALRLPGVLAVVTGRDLQQAGVKPLAASGDFRRPDGAPTATPAQSILAIDTVRYVGEPVAAIVAETKHAARDAAEAIDVQYEPLPAVADIADAVAAAAPLVWPAAAGNIACEARHGKRDAVDEAFRKAAHTVALDLVNQRLSPSPIEPRATLAWLDPDTGRLTLRVSCQTPTGLRDELCGVLGLDEASVRVVVGDVGGGFGMKTTMYPEDALAAYATRLTGRPVKWTAERIEEFVAPTQGRDVVSRVELALDTSGRFMALRVASHANLGAYATPAGVVIQLLIGPWVTTSVYDIPAIDVRIAGVLTNTTPTGPYRGAGRPEAIYFLERLVDAAARRTGIDPIELRRRNFVRPAQMPYRTPMDKTYDSGCFEKVMDQALALPPWDAFARRAAASAARGRLRGRGIATFLEWTGAEVFGERVSVRVEADGMIEIFSATQAMGQGLATTFAQLAVDVFGVPLERIRIVQGDTDRGTGFGSAGSRSLFVGGSAVHVAATRTVDKARDLAAEALEAAPTDVEYREGRFRIAGTDRDIGLFELAARQPGRAILLDSQSAVDAASWPNAAHICEVEIDPDSGAVTLDGYWSVNDVGRVVNPMIVMGQIEGGALQGIGQALCEHMVYDHETAQPLSGSFMDYALPGADMIPPFVTTMDESTPCRTNPLGVKGVGELGTIGATPAVVNAVVDALVRAGAGDRVNTLQMPLTAERVWRTLHGL
jgi:carbon-monoxide dehydrogenase large subunit